jgi:DnaK suppressor protein
MKTTVDDKLRYSEAELKEFEILISDKLEKSKNELIQLKNSISHKATGEDNNLGSMKSLEDGADSMEKEQLNQLAARTQKFITQLENALIRIKNGTYGICIDTGKLISKERLRAVPHTQHSIEAKMLKSK